MRRAANVFVVPQHRIVLSKWHETFSAVMSHLVRQLRVCLDIVLFYVAAKWGKYSESDHRFNSYAGSSVTPVEL